MLGIRVTIVRYISDEPQPGIVECQLEDAHGRRWSFVEKTAIVSAEYLDADTAYPQRDVVAGEVVRRSLRSCSSSVLLARFWSTRQILKIRGWRF
jgi:hypothetical protein